MNVRTRWLAALVPVVAACSTNDRADISQVAFAPGEVIDLGAVVTGDLPQRFWGRAMLKQFGFDRPNVFDVKPWSFKAPTGDLKGSDSFYTLFNHGGPHVDAPNHMSVGGGIDSYSIESFAGPLRVFDAQRFQPGRTIPVDLFRDSVKAGDIVLVYTNYKIGDQAETCRPHVATDEVVARRDRTQTHQPVTLVRALNRPCQVLLPPTMSQTM